MKKRIEKKQEGRMVFNARLGESTIMAVKHRAIDERRTIEAVVADALLAYLATPLPRQQRSA